jgi:hypothetical protein
VAALDGRAWLKVSKKVSKTNLEPCEIACHSNALEGDSSLVVLRSGTTEYLLSAKERASNQLNVPSSP